MSGTEATASTGSGNSRGRLVPISKLDGPRFTLLAGRIYDKIRYQWSPDAADRAYTAQSRESFWRDRRALGAHFQETLKQIRTDTARSKPDMIDPSDMDDLQDIKTGILFTVQWGVESGTIDPSVITEDSHTSAALHDNQVLMNDFGRAVGRWFTIDLIGALYKTEGIHKTLSEEALRDPDGAETILRRIFDRTAEELDETERESLRSVEQVTVATAIDGVQLGILSSEMINAPRRSALEEFLLARLSNLTEAEQFALHRRLKLDLPPRPGSP